MDYKLKMMEVEKKLFKKVKVQVLHQVQLVQVIQKQQVTH